MEENIKNIYTKINDIINENQEMRAKVDEMFQNLFANIRPVIENEQAIPLDNEISDNDLSLLIYDLLNKNLKKHKNAIEVYEKYLWLREFVKWQNDSDASLTFKYYY